MATINNKCTIGYALKQSIVRSWLDFVGYLRNVQNTITSNG